MVLGPKDLSSYNTFEMSLDSLNMLVSYFFDRWPGFAECLQNTYRTMSQETDAEMSSGPYKISIFLEFVMIVNCIAVIGFF